jgi:ribosomal protein L11 methylase PrmA
MCPLNVDITASEDDQYAFRKRSSSNQFNNPLNDSFVGVNEFCQALDDSIVIDKDTELFIGKSVLEVGFSTGIPSVFALDCGASEIAIHSYDPHSMATFVKATIKRNAIPKSVCKFSTGELDACLKSFGNKKFDIILCPELINTKQENYSAIVEILNAALADNGVILLSGREFYEDTTGSIQGFLDYIRTTNTFDAYVRWTSTKSESNRRKVIQMTRLFR